MKNMKSQKDFLGHEISVGDLVSFIQYTKTKNWLDVGRVKSITNSGVWIEFAEGFSLKERNHYFHDHWDKKNKKWIRVPGIHKISSKISKLVGTLESEKGKPKYLRIQAWDSFYGPDFEDGAGREDSVYPQLANKEKMGVDFVVDLDTHKIISHENLNDDNLFLKPVDEGIYTLMDVDMKEIKILRGYVPNKLIPEIDGCGDYIDLHIKNNIITNWYKNPSFEEFGI